LKNKIDIDKVFLGSIILFVIIVPAYIWLLLSHNMSNENINYCLSDAYCNADKYSKFVLLPLTVFIIVNMLKYDFRFAVVVRHVNVRKMWLLLCKKIFSISIFFTIYIFVTTTTIGLIYGQFQCNWSFTDSAAYSVIHNIISNPESVWWVMVAYFLVTLLTIAVMSVLTTLLWWVSGTPVIGYVGMIVFLLLEIGSKPPITKIFFAKVNLNPVSVYARGIKTETVIIYPVVVMAMLIIIGYVFIRRKDFLNKQ